MNTVIAMPSQNKVTGSIERPPKHVRHMIVSNKAMSQESVIMTTTFVLLAACRLLIEHHATCLLPLCDPAWHSHGTRDPASLQSRDERGPDCSQAKRQSEERVGPFIPACTTPSYVYSLPQPCDAPPNKESFNSRSKKKG